MVVQLEIVNYLVYLCSYLCSEYAPPLSLVQKKK
jgi:hypothetical protein